MSSKRSWRDSRENTSSSGIRFVLFVRRLLGKTTAYRLTAAVAFFAWACSPRLRGISNDYLERFKHFAEGRGVLLPKVSSRRHIARFAESMLDRLLAWRGETVFEDFISKDGALELALSVAKSEKGAFIICSHIGNAEIFRAVNRFSVGKKLTVLMLAEHNRKFMELMKSMSSESAEAQTEIMSVDEITPATAMELSQRAQNGEWIVMAADRMLHEGARCAEVDFLGARAKLPHGPWILASLLGLPVYTLYCLHAEEDKEPSLHFRSWGKIKLRRGSRSEDADALCSRFASEMEEMLLASPLDWFNFYPFWES